MRLQLIKEGVGLSESSYPSRNQLEYHFLGRGDPVAESRFQNWRIRFETRFHEKFAVCIGLVRVESVKSQTSSHWCGAEIWRWEASSDIVLAI
ncbi:hypothetical protein AVEN_255716-1 [Araneus ventricosus]|uniref:Uncharacterized protein n=1 Tax=Araneus ventricosus TaxID=182803 RepID=A0A4Y2PUA7_ARAVE|nr:hypothetical protein AVEN_255716-1 [Araneus ventricosus]